MEYEQTLIKYDNDDCMVLPILIGESIDGKIRSFSLYHPNNYLEELHFDKKKFNIRKTIQKLLEFQSFKYIPERISSRHCIRYRKKCSLFCFGEGRTERISAFTHTKKCIHE